MRREGDGGHAGADAKAFEGLVEDEDDVEGAEFVARDSQVEADDDRVEYHAEFEDQKGGDLLAEFCAAGFRAAVLELVVEVVVGEVGLGRGAWAIGFFAVLAILNVGDGALDVLLCAQAVFRLDVTLCSEIHEEDEHDGCEDDGGTPGVLRPISRHAHARVGSNLAVCWVQEMDEGGGDDDTGAEVAGEQVDIDGDADTADSFGHNGEEGCASGYDHDDEEGGNASAELTVVFIFGGVEGADDIAWVG